MRPIYVKTTLYRPISLTCALATRYTSVIDYKEGRISFDCLVKGIIGIVFSLGKKQTIRIKSVATYRLLLVIDLKATSTSTI